MLTAKDALTDAYHIVSALMRPPANFNEHAIFLVFKNEFEATIGANNRLESTGFMGLVSAITAAKYPNRIFADLLPRSKEKYVVINDDMPLTQIDALFKQNNLSEVCVFNQSQQLIGVINHTSLLRTLILAATKQYQAVIANQLTNLSFNELVDQNKKLQAINSALNNFCLHITNANFEQEYLQTFLDNLRDLMKVKYAAIRITHPDLVDCNFLYSGMSQQQADKIGRIPAGLGLFAFAQTKVEPIIIDDIKQHNASVGFPAHHPQMNSLLIASLKHHTSVYGHIFLCDKVDGEKFDSQDQGLIQSFSQLIILFLHSMQVAQSLTQVKQDFSLAHHYDQLTGLPKPKTCKESFANLLTNRRAAASSIAFIILNLDNFKMINDALGQQNGDILLTMLADRLNDCGHSDDMVAHIAADEYLLICSNIRKQNDLTIIINKYRELFANSFTINSQQYYLSASFGVALYPLDGTTFSDLVTHATIALHHAKRNGKQQIHFYTETMDKYIKRRLLVENKLRNALLANKLTLHYQPQINAEQRTICGLEALLRWHDDELGQVSPAEFIPIAENSNLIIDIGAWVLQTACAQRQAWLQQGFAHFPVAVNISALQIKQQMLIETINEVLQTTQLPAQYLELEITENCALEFPETLIDMLNQLTLMGIKLSIDDFGTGYSNLAYLAKMPINTLKIDRSFITDIASKKNGTALAYAIIDLAKRLDLAIIAEGVETKQQLAKLLEQDCVQIQGYYFFKPMPAEDCTKLLLTYQSDDYRLTINGQ